MMFVKKVGMGISTNLVKFINEGQPRVKKNKHPKNKLFGFGVIGSS